MKRIAVPVALLVIALGAVTWLQQWQRSPNVGFPAPDFTLPDLTGRPHRLADYRGKVVFLNLWATWCPPCAQEMPSMERLHRRLARPDFAMLGVSEDTGGALVVAPFVQSLGLTFPVLLDDQGRLPPRYGVTGYPETFIIDREGYVVKHHIGPAEWDDDDMIGYFASLLDHAPKSGDAVASEAR